MQMSLSRSPQTPLKQFLWCGSTLCTATGSPRDPDLKERFGQIVCVSWRRRERLSPGFSSRALHCIDILAVIYLKHQLV